MLYCECHESESKEMSSESQERICFFALFQRGSAGQNPSATAHGQGHKPAGPFVSIGGIANDPRDVQQNDKQKERSEEHTSELQSPDHLVCRLLLEKKKKNQTTVLHKTIRLSRQQAYMCMTHC